MIYLIHSQFKRDNNCKERFLFRKYNLVKNDILSYLITMCSPISKNYKCLIKIAIIIIIIAALISYCCHNKLPQVSKYPKHIMPQLRRKEASLDSFFSFYKFMIIMSADYDVSAAALTGLSTESISYSFLAELSTCLLAVSLGPPLKLPSPQFTSPSIFQSSDCQGPSLEPLWILPLHLSGSSLRKVSSFKGFPWLHWTHLDNQGYSPNLKVRRDNYQYIFQSPFPHSKSYSRESMWTPLEGYSTSYSM